MHSDHKRPYWQICTACNRRVYSAEHVTCQCGEKMIDALDHEDNAHRKHEPKQHVKPKAATSAP